MGKSILILDIGANSVRAGIFSVRKLKPICFFNRPLPEKDVLLEKGDIKDTLSSIILDIKGKGFKEFQKVFVAIPASEMSIRIVAIPFENKKRVEEVLPFELEGILPSGSAEMVINAIPIGEGKVLAVALEKVKLKYYLEILKEVGLDPSWFGSTLFSMGNILTSLNKSSGTSAFIERESIVVTSNGMPIFFKPFKAIGDINISLAYLDTEGIKIDKYYSSSEAAAELKSFLPKIDVNPISLPRDYQGNGAGIFALSQHIKKGLDEIINFRKGEFIYTREKDIFKRNLRVTAGLFLIIAGLLIGDVYLRYIGLAGQLKTLKENSKATYLKLFPGDTKVTDELYQLEAKIKGLKEEIEIIGGGINILEIMNELTHAAGYDRTANVKFYEMNIGDGKVSARGEVDSFEIANLLRDSLIKKKVFREVLLTDVTTKPGGRTGFSLSITLTQREK